MSSRATSLASSLDSPGPILERISIEDHSKIPQSGEKSFKTYQRNASLEPILSPVIRELVGRPSSTMKSAKEDDEIDVETGKLGKDREKLLRSNRTLTINNRALLAGFAYCVSSCSMILVNKYVLSAYNFNAGVFLMLYQNFVSVIVVSVLSFPGIISTEPLTWRLIKDSRGLSNWTNWLLYRGGIGVKGAESWEAWWDEELAHIRTFGGRLTETILSL